MFVNGDVEGGKEEYLNTTDTESDCEALVIKHRPTATGATWHYLSKHCRPEFGDHIVSSSRYRTCLFKFGKAF